MGDLSMGSGTDAPHPQGLSGKVELNSEQLAALLTKLSSDETAELKKTMKDCTSEVLFTRGVPFTAFVLGSMYYARTRLPIDKQFGPRGWPFYAIIGIGSLTAANVLSMGKCRERIQPQLERYWHKYQLDESKTTYAALREQNRRRWNESRSDPPRMDPYSASPLPASSTPDSPHMEQQSSLHPPPSPRFLYDDSPIMSGTPSGPPKTTQYGDFS